MTRSCDDETKRQNQHRRPPRPRGPRPPAPTHPIHPSPPGRGDGGEGERVIVRVDPRYFRPTEVETLLGDASKAREKLGWRPRVSFPELVAEMVREDLKSAEREALVKRHGFPGSGHPGGES